MRPLTLIRILAFVLTLGSEVSSVFAVAQNSASFPESLLSALDSSPSEVAATGLTSRDDIVWSSSRAQNIAQSDEDQGPLSTSIFSYDDVNRDVGRCGQWDFFQIKNITYKVAPCKGDGLVLIYQPSFDSNVRASEEAVIRQNGYPRVRKFPMMAVGSAVTSKYIFVALGSDGLGVFQTEDAVRSGPIFFKRLQFQAIADVSDVAILLDRAGNEQVLYVTSKALSVVKSLSSDPNKAPDVESIAGVATIPFKIIEPRIEALALASEEVAMERFPTIPLDGAQGIAVVDERVPGREGNQFLTLVVTTAWGHLRLFGLDDPEHPATISASSVGVWTPFEIKRVNGELQYKVDSTPLVGITPWNPSTGELLLTNAAGRSEFMNLKEYMLITSATQMKIYNWVAKKFGHTRAFWTGFLTGPFVWMDGVSGSFQRVVMMGIPKRFINPVLGSIRKVTHLPVPQIPLPPDETSSQIQAMNKNLNRLRNASADFWHLRSKEWRDYFAKTGFLDPEQAYALDVLIQSGEGDGQLACGIVALLGVQLMMAAEVAPVIQKVAPYTGNKLSPAYVRYGMTKLAEGWAMTLNRVLSNLNVNMRVHPIQITHVQQPLIWLAVDDGLEFILSIFDRADRKDPAERMFSSNMFDSTHAFWIHENVMFDLALNGLLVMVQQPGAFAGVGATRSRKIEFYSTRAAWLAETMAFTGRKFAARYQVVLKTNFLIRSWTDIITQVVVREKMKGIPFSAFRHAHDIAYQPEWVIPSRNIAWLFQDFYNTGVKTNLSGGQLKFAMFWSEYLTAFVHSVASSPPIIYANRTLFDRHEPKPLKLFDAFEQTVKLDPFRIVPQ